MKINVISDLHCAVKDNKVNWMLFEPERLEPADYLIVAGDSGYSTTERVIHKELRERTTGLFKQVLTIKGNHSYWAINPDSNDDMESADELFMAPNDTIDVVDGNVAIIGTTLWTNAVSIPEVRYMNDFRFIPEFSPKLKLKRYETESRWLRNKYNEYKSQGKKIVIVTHHNPRSSLILPEYSREHEDVKTAYWMYKADKDWPDWETEIEKMSFSNFHKGLVQDVGDLKPEIWICGHIHESLDIEHDGIRFVRHPIGYRWGWYRPDPEDPKSSEYMATWYNKVLEIN